MTIEVIERCRRNGEEEVVDEKDWTIEWELQNEVGSERPTGDC